MRYLIIMFLALFYSYQTIADDNTSLDGYKMENHLQPWRVSPKAPDGWKLIDQSAGEITGTKSKDTFFLVTDGKNELLLWFYKKGNFWEMSVIDSIETKSHKEYGVDPLDLKIFIEDDAVLYGVEGSETITRYEGALKSAYLFP